ncbi:Uncharacterised protein [Serratia fonticola]|uniref:Uncharacterized protein n=1 Tax=Serratia fonticola TaxID=47917 RepID=A0A4U9WL82_SERFO|nr:Uncharacterised protein [Serratia fonticola]
MLSSIYRMPQGKSKHGLTHWPNAPAAMPPKRMERIDQRRKYTNDPYIVHPQAVMEIVSSVPHSEEMLAGGLAA